MASTRAATAVGCPQWNTIVPGQRRSILGPLSSGQGQGACTIGCLDHLAHHHPCSSASSPIAILRCELGVGSGGAAVVAPSLEVEWAAMQQQLAAQRAEASRAQQAEAALTTQLAEAQRQLQQQQDEATAMAARVGTEVAAQARAASEAQLNADVTASMAAAAQARASALEEELEAMLATARWRQCEQDEPVRRVEQLLKTIQRTKKVLKRTSKTSARHSKTRRDLARDLATAKAALAKENAARVLLSSESSAALRKLLLTAQKDMPAKQTYLRALIDDQLKCMKNKSGWCRWHPAVLEICDRIRRASSSAYEMLTAYGMVSLPTADHLRRRAAQVGSATGHDLARYDRIGAALDELKLEGGSREVVLLFDEINVVGNIAFKIVNGKYELYGLIDTVEADERVFHGPPKADATASEEPFDGHELLATHALVFQVGRPEGGAGETSACERGSAARAGTENSALGTTGLRARRHARGRRQHLSARRRCPRCPRRQGRADRQALLGHREEPQEAEPRARVSGDLRWRGPQPPLAEVVRVRPRAWHL